MLTETTNQVKPFIMVEYDLLKAKGFISHKTSKPEKLTPNDKLVYVYVRARIKYFVEEKKGEYYDTQEAIANALCMDIKSARKALDKLIESGILVACKKLHRNYYNYRYYKMSEITLWEYGDSKDDIKIIKPTYAEVKNTVKSKPVQKAAPQVQSYLDDDLDLPF